MSVTGIVGGRDKLWLAGVAAAAMLLLAFIRAAGSTTAILFLVGMVLGVTLHHAALGFTGAYRRLFVDRDISGVTAQLVMLALAMVLFAPVLSSGEVLGRAVTGAVAPVGLSMFLGAFVFGVGMQLGGGCGSGTLCTVAGGDLRMVVTLVFFCLGGFWGSLHLHWWRQLPELPAVSLGVAWGYPSALLFQLALLAVIYLLLRRFAAARHPIPRARQRPSQSRLIHGPWPLLAGAAVLALLNWATLLLAGHPWSITWGFTLWGAKAALLAGWDPATSGFWSGGFQHHALAAPVLADVISVMNLGIIVGALLALILAGRLRPPVRPGARALLASVIGGLMMGYAARLAYGCNIGAFFSGVASTSVHGWVWIVAALAGNWLGVKLRPWFRLTPY